MGSSENFCLRWNDFEANVSGAFRDLRAESDFFDVTLGCSDSNGRSLQAHKVILSACSSFFKGMLRQQAQQNPAHPHPFIYLRGVSFCDLSSVLDFMYHGEVNVAQEDLNSFLAVAEELQIKGLTNKDGEPSKAAGGGSAPKPAKSRPSEAGGPPVKRIRKSSPAPSSSNNTSQAGASASGGGGPDHDVKSVVDIKSDPEAAGPSSSGAGGAGQAVTSADYADESGDFGDYGGDDYGGYDDNGEGGDMMTGDVSVEGGEESQGGKGKLKGRQQPVLPSFDDGLNKFLAGEKSPYDALMEQHGTLWQCLQCDHAARKKYDMQVHIDGKHGAFQGVACKICHRQFKNKNSLKAHNYTEHKLGGNANKSRQQPVVVVESPDLTSADYDLLMEKYGAKEWRCLQCLYVSSKREDMRTHIEGRHGIFQGIACEICQRQFKNKNSLKVHKYNVHGGRKNAAASFDDAQS